MKVKLSRKSRDTLSRIQDKIEISSYLNPFIIGVSIFNIITSTKVITKVFTIQQTDFDLIISSIQ